MTHGQPGTHFQRATYRRRPGLVEPVFAHTAAHKRTDHSTLHGSIKVNIQWKLYRLVHTLEKITRFSPGQKRITW